MFLFLLGTARNPQIPSLALSCDTDLMFSNQHEHQKAARAPFPRVDLGRVWGNPHFEARDPHTTCIFNTKTAIRRRCHGACVHLYSPEAAVVIFWLRGGQQGWDKDKQRFDWCLGRDAARLG